MNCNVEFNLGKKKSVHCSELLCSMDEAQLEEVWYMFHCTFGTGKRDFMF